MNTLEIVVAKGFLWSNTLLNTGRSMHNFEDVSSRVRDGIDDLFDNSKPHFAAWLRMHDMDERWYRFSPMSKSTTVMAPRSTMLRCVDFMTWRNG
jgi:hypothetical protein